MGNISVGLLNSFVIFNDSNNLVEAANRLGITQPALSKQLKQLEKAISEPVFTMQGRKKVLTPFGRILQEQLKHRLGNIQEIVRQAKKFHQNPSQAKLRIAGRRGILDRISIKLKFDGALFFLESSNASIFEALTNFSAEIGITHIVPNSYELMAKPLFREEFQLIIPKSFLAHRPMLNENLFQRLKGFPCLGYKINDEILVAVCSFYSIKIADIKMARATENYTSIASMAAAELGWAIIPAYLKVSEKDLWAISVPVKALPARQFFIIFRSEYASVPWFKELIKEIQSCF